VDRAELELQLEVWKDLAISKQMLIGAAAEALGINSECSMEEIKEAFEKATQRATQADAAIAKAKEDAENAIAEMQAKVKANDIELAKAKETAENAEEALKAADQRVDAGREANADALKKANAQIAEKDKALKQIKKVLADSPENVVKKLKVLKKEKMDEANARKKAEEEARRQKKDKQKSEQEVKDLQSTIEQCGALVEQVRELKTFSEAQYDQLKELVEDAKKLEKTPKLDEELLTSIEKLAGKDDDEEEKSSKSSGNKKKATKKKAKKK
jgi:colicin import membrane protein